MSAINLNLSSSLILQDAPNWAFSEMLGDFRVFQVYCEVLYKKEETQVNAAQIYLEILKKNKSQITKVPQDYLEILWRHGYTEWEITEE